MSVKQNRINKSLVEITEWNANISVPKAIYGLMLDIKKKSERIGQDLTYLEIYHQLPEELKKQVTVTEF